MGNILKPAFNNNNIPIVFSADRNFFPYLDVCLKSLIDNSNQDNNLDIVILYSDIENHTQKRLLENQKPNVSIRFVNADYYIQEYDKIWYTHWNYSSAIYYRFFIPQIFKNYEKVLYLDSDTIINCDIKELFDIDLEGNYAGAVQEITQQMEGYFGERFREEKLFVEREKYFNSGMLLLDIQKLNNDDFLNKCIKTLNELQTPPFPDQDVLNVVLKDKIKYLPFKYNQLWNCLHYYKDAKFKMKPEIWKDYYNSWEDVKIIHYAGAFKPWKMPWLNYSECFFKYARKSSFYEEIIYKNQTNKISRYSIKNAIQKKQIYTEYFFNKILKIVLFGKNKKQCTEKIDALKKRVMDYRETFSK